MTKVFVLILVLYGGNSGSPPVIDHVYLKHEETCEEVGTKVVRKWKEHNDNYSGFYVCAQSVTTGAS